MCLIDVLFDDNRPFLRRLSELPYVWRRIRGHLLRPQFLVFFLRSVHLVRLVMIILVYLIIPLDLIPERILGFIGYIDDLLVSILILTFFLSVGAIQYHRLRGGE